MAPTIKVHEIIDVCSQVALISKKTLFSRTHSHEHADARRAIAIVALDCGHTKSNISRVMRRHPSTVYNYLRGSTRPSQNRKAKPVIFDRKHDRIVEKIRDRLGIEQRC